MNLKRLLSARGVHYIATRFGWSKLRSMAFDEKYRSGTWVTLADGVGEFPFIVQKYLNAGDLLMLGCGGASLLEGLDLPTLRSVLGVDLSPEAIRLAGCYSRSNVTFQVGNMETFDPPNNYDVILFSESLNYVPLPKQGELLRRLSGRLKPGGVFVITFAEAERYRDMLDAMRRAFTVHEDRHFRASKRHLIVVS